MNNTDPQVDLHAPDLWHNHEKSDGLNVHLRGHVFDGGLLSELHSGIVRDSVPALSNILKQTDGLFTVIIEDTSCTCVAVDRIMSIPMFYGWNGKKWRISDNGGALAHDLNLGLEDVNPEGALAIAMAGYTIGSDTLYHSLKMLPAGHAVILGPAKQEQRFAYDCYASWEIDDRSDAVLEQQLTDVTLSILKKLIRSVGDRPIVVPLSAGLDSRLIVSGLKHLKFENVKCFSYGIPGNHEAVGAKKIAEKLGYPWHFVPYNRASMKQFFASEDHQNYLKFADSCIHVPFEQDLYAIRTLQEDGYISKDAVIVNGNSGDYISGNHIMPPFRELSIERDISTVRNTIFKTILEKHFRLWNTLGTPENDARLAKRLSQELTAPLDNPGGYHGGYEFMEYQDRQAKYVISGQRIYDYAGLEWRLPLWDCEYLDFWRTVPLRAKANQVLYKNMLHSQNWGGVWKGNEWIFPQTVVPKWLWVLRFFLKTMHAPLGQAAWHKFEKRYITYWIGNLQVQADVSYLHMIRDTRGARHLVAWLSQSYLQSKGLDWQGKTKV